MLLDPSDRLLTAGSEEFIFRTNPPRVSSTRLSLLSASLPPLVPSLLLNEVKEARMALFARNFDAFPKGALVRTP